MVRNKQELLAKASEWVNHAKNDLRSSLINFMERVGADQNRIANALGLSVGEVDQILNGNGEITLSTFAKLLVATNNVLEIKPLTEVRGAIKPNGIPRGGFPNPNQLHRMTGSRPTAVPPMGSNLHPFGAPMAPPMGGNIPMGQEIDLDTLSMQELRMIAIQSGLTARMPITRMSREQLIDALERQQQEDIASGRLPNPNCATKIEEPSFMNNIAQDEEEFGDADDCGNEAEDEWNSFDDTEAEDTQEMPQNEDGGFDNDSHLASLLIDELDNNPRLRELIKNHLG